MLQGTALSCLDECGVAWRAQCRVLVVRVISPVYVQSAIVFQVTASDPTVVFGSISYEMNQVPVTFSHFFVINDSVDHIFLRAVDYDRARQRKRA